MKHKSRVEKDRRYAASAKGVARRRRYDRSLKGRARARCYRKSMKGRRATHRYNVSPKGVAKRERSLANMQVRQPSSRTTAVPVPEAHRLNPAAAPAKPERNMREEILRRTAAVFGGPNRGDTGGSRSVAPRSADELLDRYHRLRGK